MVLQKLNIIIKLMASLRFISSLLLFILCTSAFANDILKGISFEEKGNKTEIKVDLSIPFDYVKHFPNKRGKIIQIQLNVDEEVRKKIKIKRRETLRPESGQANIRDVIYEGNVRGGPYLVFRFTRIVEFSVEKINNAQTFIVRIEKQSESEFLAKQKNKKLLATKNKKLDEAGQIMADARNALTNGANGDAILLFTKLLSMPEHKHIADAKEYLGLARERNGQLELARKEYEEYIKIYPKKRRTNTVKQRLMTLKARIARPRKQLKESRRTLALRRKDGLKRTDIFGRFSQTFYTAFIRKEATGVDNQQNLLLNFFNASWRQRDTEKETRLVFSGSHEEDFKKSVRKTRIRSLYGDYKNKRKNFQVSLGRQSVNSGGVLGRFDGGVVGFQIKPKFRGYFVGGFPVDFVDNLTLQSNKPILGARLDIKDILPHWQGSSYIIRQWVDGVNNRSAVGADMRYFNNKNIFYSLIDYDVSFKTMNFLTAHYGWQFNKKTKIDLHYDRRRSPVMLTSNALQGLGGITNETLSDLSRAVNSAELIDIKKRLSIQSMLDAGMTIKEIRQRAIDNTGYSTLVTFSVRRTLKKDLELNGNVTLSSYAAGKNLQNNDEDDEPEDTSFIPSNFDKVIYGQMIQRNYFKQRDILIGGLRYSDNTSSTRYEVNSSVRYPFRKKWWFDVKMRFMYTVNKAREKDAARANPKIRIEYRHNKKVTFQGEIGTEINKSQIESEDYVWTSGNIGYRYLF